MRDIRVFIRGRVDEDMAQAHDAASRNRPDWSCPASGVLDVGDVDLVLVHDGGVGEHMRRHDPAHVMREAAIKYQRLRLHTPDQLGSVCCYCDQLWPCEDLRLEAFVYAEHPDFDPNWKPVA